MIRPISAAIVALLVVAGAPALALDPPHGLRLTNKCIDCHQLHRAPGMTITKTAGNNNLCRSCHNSTVTYAPMTNWQDTDQAVPGVTGRMHRWGDRTGDTDGALAVNPAHDAEIPQNGQIKARLDGSTDATKKLTCSACHNQHSQENAPPDTNAPAYTGAGSGWTSSGVGRHYQRVSNSGNELCRDCHRRRNVTSSNDGSHPIDVTIPAAAGFKTPAALTLIGGKVYCTTCHSPHNATSGGANGGAGDGYLLDLSIGSLCYQCHENNDPTNGSHFRTDLAGGIQYGVLWPGGQYGSNRPANPGGYRGYCVNCHWPHGSCDSATPGDGTPCGTSMTNRNKKLWIEKYDASRTVGADADDAEDLCFTCHDKGGTIQAALQGPATSDLRSDFADGTNTVDNVFHHPVKDSEQALYGRSVECVDCHNPHKARSDNRHAGVSGVDWSGNAITLGENAKTHETEQPMLCFKCHGDTYASGRARTSNKRLDFLATSSNSAYHPVQQPGRGRSANLAAQLSGAGLDPATSTIRCTECHNSDAFSGTSGKITDSSTTTTGPHGSTYAPILRANFSTNYTGQSWSSTNANLCFRCHSSTALFGSNTNFNDSADPPNSRGKGNLHDYHLSNRSVTSSCLSCHFDIHSNRSASNTQYRWTTDGSTWQTSDSPPPGIKTHLVNFAPDVQAGSGTKPRWQINTVTGVRTCSLRCHGEADKMVNVDYKPSSGDETSHTYTLCTDGDGDGYYSDTGCGTTVDCNDSNGQVHPGVVENTAGLCADAVDNDCDAQTDCEDNGCVGAIQENTSARCNDGQDNDCDFTADCFDSDCRAAVPVSCPCTDADGDGWSAQAYCANPSDCADDDAARSPGLSENTVTYCGDTRDNDCDTQVDCSDTQCVNVVAENTTARCGDGRDNDCDGKSDCADSTCAGLAGCPVCTDGDGDGYFGQSGCGTTVDCADNDADRSPGKLENTIAYCADTKDNDCDGNADCVDSQCLNVIAENTSASCADGRDNDCDGLTDCQETVSCLNVNSESSPTTRCSDNVDNDCDGVKDCSDTSCNGISPCVTCTDGDGDTYPAQDGCAMAKDCNDANNQIHPGLVENTGALCNDMLDNDCDGQRDCFDTGCSTFLGEDTSTDCSNTTDTDVDGKNNCKDLSCWWSGTTLTCGGSGRCRNTNNECCRDGNGTTYACYRVECNSRTCDRSGPCDRL